MEFIKPSQHVDQDSVQTLREYADILGEPEIDKALSSIDIALTTADSLCEYYYSEQHTWFRKYHAMLSEEHRYKTLAIVGIPTAFILGVLLSM